MVRQLDTFPKPAGLWAQFFDGKIWQLTPEDFAGRDPERVMIVDSLNGQPPKRKSCQATILDDGSVVIQVTPRKR